MVVQARIRRGSAGRGRTGGLIRVAVGCGCGVSGHARVQGIREAHDTRGDGTDRDRAAGAAVVVCELRRAVDVFRRVIVLVAAAGIDRLWAVRSGRRTRIGRGIRAAVGLRVVVGRGCGAAGGDRFAVDVVVAIGLGVGFLAARAGSGNSR